MNRLRPGEVLGGAWLVLVVSTATVLDEWSRVASNLLENEAYYPPVFILLLVLSWFLVRLGLLSGTRLAATVQGLWRGSGRIDWQDEVETLRGAGRFLRDVAPLFVTVYSYPTTDFLIDHIHGSRLYDEALIVLDQALFGTQLSVWMERFVNPGLTDLLGLCYFLHLFVPALVLGYIWVFRPRSLLVETVQGFAVMMVVGLSLYVIVPAIGPTYNLTYTKSLQGGVIEAVNRTAIEMLRVPRDVFPSLHVGISALILVYAFRADPRLALLVLPVTVGNWAATLYLRYHYAIDCLVGFLLVPLIYRPVRRWAARTQQAEAAEDRVTLIAVA